MTSNSRSSVGALLLRGLLLPVGLLAWAAVIVLALSESPSETKTTAFDSLTRVILAGHQ